MPEATFFESPAGFEAWLQENHDKAQVLVVGFYNKNSGRPSITYPEALDAAQQA